MNRPTLAAALLVMSFLVSTCGKDSPAAPPNQTPTPTRIIRLGGNLNFGNVNVGDARTDGILVVTNDGNSTLTVRPFLDAQQVERQYKESREIEVHEHLEQCEEIEHRETRFTWTHSTQRGGQARVCETDRLPERTSWLCD